MSEDTTRREIQDGLERAQKYLEAGRLRRADEILGELLEQARKDDLIDLEEEIEDLRMKLVGRSRQITEEVKRELDEMFGRPPEEFSPQEADQLLSRWERASLDEGDPLLARYRQLRERMWERREQAKRAQDVRLECEALWERAEEIEKDPDSTMAPEAILEEYYDKARKIAEEALANDPQNVELDRLVKEATQRRERAAELRKLMTSAVQFDMYKEVLDNLVGKPEDELVPVYDENGSFERRMPVKEAYEYVRRVARNVAARKFGEYRAGVEQALKNHNPRSAESERKKIEKLEEFLEEAHREVLRELEDRIQSQLRQLEEAEELAREAREEFLARRSEKETWERYVEARGRYKWAPEVKVARERILEEFRRRLEGVLEQAEELWEGREYKKLERLVNRTRDRYKPVADDDEGTPVRELLEELTDIYDMAREHRDAVRKARPKLAEIERLSRTDPVKAAEELGKLEETFGEEVLGDISEYERLKSRVRTLSNAKQEFERLQQFLKSSDAAEVESAYEQASEAESTAGEYAPLFRELAERLRIHHRFLVAERDYKAGRYEAASDAFYEIRGEPLLPQEDRGRIESYIEEIEKKRAEQKEIDEQLARAEQLLLGDAPDPKSAWDILKEIRPFNREQAQRLRNLKEKARKKWRQEIESKMEQWFGIGRRNGQLPLQEVQDALTALAEELGLRDRYNYWRDRMRPFILAQEARELEEEGGGEEELKEALKRWEDARGLTDDPKLKKMYSEGVARVEKRLVSLLKERAVRGRDEGELRRADAELRELSTKYPNDPELAIWHAEVKFELACSDKSHENRRALFSAMLELANRARGLLVSNPDPNLQERADELMRLAIEKKRSE